MRERYPRYMFELICRMCGGKYGHHTDDDLKKCGDKFKECGK